MGVPAAIAPVLVDKISMAGICMTVSCTMTCSVGATISVKCNDFFVDALEVEDAIGTSCTFSFVCDCIKLSHRRNKRDVSKADCL